MSYIEEARNIVEGITKDGPAAIRDGTTSEVEKKYRAETMMLLMRMTLDEPTSCLGEEADTLVRRSCQALLLPVGAALGRHATERDLLGLVTMASDVTRTLFDELLAEQMNLPEEDLKTEGQ